MKMKVVIKVSAHCSKCRNEAMKKAVSVYGVESVSWGPKEEGKGELTVVGDEIDVVELVRLLRKKVGHVEIISIGPVDEKNKRVYKQEATPPSFGYQNANAGPRYGYYEISEPSLVYDHQISVGSLVSGFWNKVAGFFKRRTECEIPEQSHGDDPLRGGSLSQAFIINLSDTGDSGAPSSPSTSHDSSEMAKNDEKLECWLNPEESLVIRETKLQCGSWDEEKSEDKDDLELLIATPPDSSSTCSISELPAENQNRPFPNLYHSRPVLSCFRAEVFAELDLSHIRGNQPWHGSQKLRSLRSLDISHSKLKKLPNLSGACNVKTLYLEGCTDLVDVSSIRNLINLEILNLKGCRSLLCLPIMIQLKHLSSVDLSDCSNLKGLPLSIGFLSSLVSLDLQNCKELQHLPTVIVALESLKTINISGCSKLLKLTSITDDDEDISGPLHFDASSSSVPLLELKSAEVEGFHKAEVASSETHTTREMIPIESVSLEEQDSAVQLCSTPLQRHWKELERYMGMPLEAIHEADTFQYVEELAGTLIRQASNIHDMSILKDIISCLEEFKGSIPDVVMCGKVARDNRSVLEAKSTRVGLSLTEAKEEFNSLDAKLAMIF